MIELSWIFLGLILPFGTAAVVVIFLTWPWRTSDVYRAKFAWPPACAAGAVLGILVEGGWPRWPPATAPERLFLWILPIALLVDLFIALPIHRQKLVWPLRVLVVLLYGYLLLYHSVYLSPTSASASPGWSRLVPIIELLAIAAAMLVPWSLLEWSAHHAPGRRIPLGLSLAALGAGLGISLSGSWSVGHLAFSLAATLAGVWLAMWLTPAAAVPTPTTGVPVVFLVSLLAIGRFFADLTTTNALLLALAPLGILAAQWPPLRRRPPWLATLAALAVIGLLIALAVVPAGLKFAQDMKQSDGAEY